MAFAGACRSHVIIAELHVASRISIIHGRRASRRQRQNDERSSVPSVDRSARDRPSDPIFGRGVEGGTRRIVCVAFSSERVVWCCDVDQLLGSFCAPGAGSVGVTTQLAASAWPVDQRGEAATRASTRSGLPCARPFRCDGAAWELRSPACRPRGTATLRGSLTLNLESSSASPLIRLLMKIPSRSLVSACACVRVAVLAGMSSRPYCGRRLIMCIGEVPASIKQLVYR